MRPVTVAAVIVVVATLGAVVGVAVFGPPGTDSVTLEERWVSDTAREGEVNHHSPAVGLVDGRAIVYAPISARSDGGPCSLVALDADGGSGLWDHTVRSENCTIHAVADPTVADYDADGDPEVLVGTTDDVLLGFDARSGEEELRYGLASYGYTEPVVDDLTGDGSPEILIVDARGTVHAVRPNGTAVWTRDVDSYVWAAPAVADFDADGDREIAVGVGSGRIEVLDGDGTTVTNASEPIEDLLTTMAVGDTDGDPAVEIVATTRDGDVVAVDGATGESLWTRDLGDLAAVAEIVAVEGDPMVYATAGDGRLHALDAATGETAWTTTLTSEDVQMTPAPILGDLDGDDGPELVAVTNDGRVLVVDPASGDVFDSYRRGVTIWTSPAVADVDGDGADDVFVIYGDGRVVALSNASEA